MKKSELKALIREVIQETTSFKRGDKVWWNDNDAFKTKRRAEVLTVSKGDVSLKDLDTGTTFVAKAKDLTKFEEISSKSRYTPEQIQKLQNLGFHWISEDNEWYNDKDREMHIYFDEGLAEYVLLTFIWNDEESDYEKDYTNYKSLDKLIAAEL